MLGVPREVWLMIMGNLAAEDRIKLGEVNRFFRVLSKKLPLTQEELCRLYLHKYRLWVNLNFLSEDLQTWWTGLTSKFQDLYQQLKLADKMSTELRSHLMAESTRVKASLNQLLDSGETRLEQEIRRYCQKYSTQPLDDSSSTSSSAVFAIPIASQSVLTQQTCLLEMEGFFDLFRLLRLKPNLEQPNGRGKTVLMVAAGIKSAKSVVRELLSFGANAHAINPSNQATAAHYAALCGSVDNFDLIVKKAPDTLDCVNTAKQTPLQLAVAVGEYRLALMNLDKLSSNPQLFTAQDLERFRLIQFHNNKLNAWWQNKLTTLFADNTNQEMLELLGAIQDESQQILVTRYDIQGHQYADRLRTLFAEIPSRANDDVFCLFWLAVNRHMMCEAAVGNIRAVQRLVELGADERWAFEDELPELSSRHCCVLQ